MEHLASEVDETNYYWRKFALNPITKNKWLAVDVGVWLLGLADNPALSVTKPADKIALSRARKGKSLFQRSSVVTSFECCIGSLCWREPNLTQWRQSLFHHLLHLPLPLNQLHHLPESSRSHHTFLGFSISLRLFPVYTWAICGIPLSKLCALSANQLSMTWAKQTRAV